MTELKDECLGGFLCGEYVCAECLTDEDIKNLDGVLSKDEQAEAEKHRCSRCHK